MAGNAKLVVDGGYDERLIEAIRDERLPVSRLVLHAPRSPVGNGSIFLPQEIPSREAFEGLTKLAQEVGIIPIAGIDSTCQANLQDHVEHNQIENAFFEGLRRLGYQELLVSSPNMIGFVKARIPGAKVHVSYSQCVTSTNRAAIFFEFGADALQLHPDVVRNLDLLRNLLKLARAAPPATGPRALVLPVNIGCNWGCIHWYQHHNLQSHRTLVSPLQPAPESVSQVPDGFDYPLLDCWRKRLERPWELLKAGWIPPEDLGRYRALGYDTFLLVTSGLDMAESVRLIRSYADQVPLVGFERYLAVAHPYGRYWPVESARQALPGLDAGFLSAFCSGFPFDEVYPFESRVDEYCRSLASKLKPGDDGAKARVLEIAARERARIEDGAGGP